MKSIRKAAEVLRLLASPPHDMSVAEVARALRVTASNASRILAELRDAELLHQDVATRRYRPGPLAMRLAAGFQQTTDILSCVQETMPELVGRTSHTAWAGVLDGADVVALRTQHGGYPVRFEIDLGKRLPAHATAMGKVLLALLPDADVRRRMRGRLNAVTPHTITTLPALLSELASIRARGYGISDQELFAGIKSIASTSSVIASSPALIPGRVRASTTLPSGAVH